MNDVAQEKSVNLEIYQEPEDSLTVVTSSIRESTLPKQEDTLPVQNIDLLGLDAASARAGTLVLESSSKLET